ncbi:class I SAM-dependent methyltransferase [Devosia sp.]|uniref:class I SAM-dependent DNA methyltransferase n=1 Tax=Devosia sp. TaxID=1871048 RepID=UPI001B16CF55|nr:class I SAM-dependent methyltransferase [Devosia sp.]MBO9591138.1 class I SAM-dependent methyltransferase [Devosia sp.]
MSSENFDIYSAYYDLLYEGKKYGKEAQFIAKLLERYGAGDKHLLELGCGTGIHATHFAQMGFTVHGIDRSPEMLRVADERSSLLEDDIASRLSFAVGDLRDFSAPSRYDHVISLFDVMSYLPDNGAFKQALSNIKSVLKPGGLLVFDCWYGPGVYTQKPHVRTRRLIGENAEILRIAEPEFHYDRNVIDVNYDIFVKDRATGRLQQFQERHPMRCFFDAELDELLGQAAFSRVFAMEWFTEKAPSIQTWSALFGYRLAQ